MRAVKTGLLLLLLVFASGAPAQPAADSLADPPSAQADTSVLPVYRTAAPEVRFALFWDSTRYRPRLFYSFANPVRYNVTERIRTGRDAAFYTVVALLLVFAFVKASFGRYLVDLNSSFFRTTMRQRQIKEQLLQSPLPSMLFNVFFVASAAVFLALLVQYLGFAKTIPFWQLTAYAAAGVAGVYAVKFLVLKLAGWLFGMTEAVDAYVFIVFSANKILGVALLPFTVMLALTTGSLTGGAVLLGYVVIGGLFLYRYFLALVSVGPSARWQPFHFLLYVAAAEVLPLLLLNKLLLTVLRQMA